MSGWDGAREGERRLAVGCMLSHSAVSSFLRPLDSSLTGSPGHGIFQARILEWVAISYSRGSSQFRDQTHVSSIFGIGRQILYLCVTYEALRDRVQVVMFW